MQGNQEGLPHTKRCDIESPPQSVVYGSKRNLIGTVTWEATGLPSEVAGS
jgi:hypothetical protein